MIGAHVSPLSAMWVAGAGVAIPELGRLAAKLRNVRQARLIR